MSHIEYSAIWVISSSTYTYVRHDSFMCTMTRSHVIYLLGYRAGKHLVALQSVAVCCNVLQCVAVCCNIFVCIHIRLESDLTCLRVLRTTHTLLLCSALQCVAVCCSVLQCVAVCSCTAYERPDVLRVLNAKSTTLHCNVLQYAAVCVAVCCSVLQCVAVFSYTTYK